MRLKYTDISIASVVLVLLSVFSVSAGEPTDRIRKTTDKLIEIVTNIIMLLILFYSHFTINSGVIVGEIFAFFAYINMFFRPLRNLAENFNTFQGALAALERIVVLFDKEIKIKDNEKF